MNKQIRNLILAIVSAAATTIGMAGAIGEAKLPIILMIFAGGFGAGATITSAIISYNKKE